MPRRRAHVALIGFESVDLMVGGSFVSKSVGCCREGMLDACDPRTSKWCFRGTARAKGRFEDLDGDNGDHEEDESDEDDEDYGSNEDGKGE